MSISSRSYARPYLNVPSFPTGVKWLVISNIAVFLLSWFVPTAGQFFMRYFALRPDEAIPQIWTLATYLFLHGGIGHILWNMLALWMFGADLELSWGTRRFLRFYFFCGIGAGVCVVIFNYLFGNPHIPTIGASGAIYGILLANAVLWPDRIILFSFLFPIKMKYFVMIIGAISFLNATGANTGVSEFAHLGGMAFAYLFLKLPSRRRGSSRGFDPVGTISRGYHDWKIARAKRKFQVYLRKQNSDRGGHVN
jgi:membrane associated rhomboid family serine protease